MELKDKNTLDFLQKELDHRKKFWEFDGFFKKLSLFNTREKN